MCTSPLLIRNPKKNPVVGFDPHFLQVPCGTCNECRMHKTDDWYLRNYFEWRQNQRDGGFTQFITTTYDDVNLPHCTSLNIPCFSRPDVQKFLKRLRYYVHADIRFFLACEYGEVNHRPHYHWLFFVSNGTITPDIFARCVHRAWHKGITYTSDINNGVIIDSRGIKYAAKYVAKDVATQDWFLGLRAKFKCSLPLRGKCYDDWKEFEKTRPFVQSSRNFGYCMIRDPFFNLKVAEQGSIVILDSSNVGKVYKLPLYIERRLFYVRKTVDGSPRYVLSDYGRKVISSRFDIRLNALKYRIAVLSSLSYSEDMSNFFKRNGYDINSYLNFHMVKDKVSLPAYLTYCKYFGSCFYDVSDDISSKELPLSVCSADYTESVYFDSSVDYSKFSGIMYKDLQPLLVDDIVSFVSDVTNIQFHNSLLALSSYLSYSASVLHLKHEKQCIAIRNLKRKTFRNHKSNYVI